MGNKITKFKAYWEGVTGLSSSRWGIFFALFGIGGILITIGFGGLSNMNGFVIAGIVIFALAICWGVYCIVTGSKDKTATTDDIKELGNVLGTKIDEVKTAINNLADEIGVDRESRSNNKGTNK